VRRGDEALRHRLHGGAEPRHPPVDVVRRPHTAAAGRLLAAERGEIKIIWVYLSSAGYEETRIKDYQAAYDPSRPLAALPAAKRDDALKQIAVRIKLAVFD
jgi:hypothetical protein